MHYVSLIVEFLRGRPAVVFWTAALGQAALWFVMPALFYSAPPNGLAQVLMVGQQFLLGSYLGPPLAFWLAELAFRIAGSAGVYLLAQLCVVVALWAVFRLGSAIVGVRHAVLAVLLMIGISALTLQTVDFGPAILAMPFWALAVLHYWRAACEGHRGYWLLLALDLGLLLLTSASGLILLALIVIYTLIDPRARASLRYVEPWLAVALLLFVVAPYLGWLAQRSDLAWVQIAAFWRDAAATAALRFVGLLIIAHIGLMVLIGLAGGWPRDRRERPPVIEDRVRAARGRWFIIVFSTVPILAALALAALFGSTRPLEPIAPFVLLSGLLAIAITGTRIKLYRERLVSFAWLGLLVLPPVIIVLVLGMGPWVAAAEFRVAQPADAMGRFFAESFLRRTGQPLHYIAGDERLAAVVAVGAPSRPSVYAVAEPAHTPWVTTERFRQSGGIIVWPVTDTIGTPPPAVRAAFPDLVVEVPRVFERPIEGRLPLLRVGWAVVRPAATATAQ